MEDGSELLIISKPLNRTNIFLSKILMILLFGLMNSLISLIVTSTIFAFPNSIYDYSLIALFGVPIATLIIYIAFSSLALLISVFMKKSLSLITISVINVILLFFTIFNIFVVDIRFKNDNTFTNSYRITHPITLNQNNQLDKKSVVSNVNGTDFYESYQNESSQRLYPKLSPINFYQQLSNMYGLNKQFMYLENSSLMGYSTLNYPFRFVFDFSESALEPNNLDVSLNLNINQNLTVPFYFGVRYRSLSYITMQDYSFENLNNNNGQTGNQNDQNNGEEGWGDFDYKLIIARSRNTGIEDFSDFINSNNNYFHPSEFTSFIETAVTNYIKNSTTPLEDEVWTHTSFQGENHLNYLKTYALFFNVEKLSKYAISLFLSSPKYFGTNIRNSVVLSELNRMVLQFINSDSIDFNIDIPTIKTIVKEWDALNNKSSSEEQKSQAKRTEFLQKHLDTIVNLIKLKMIGFDLSYYFYGLYDLVMNDIITNLSDDEDSLWSYLNPNGDDDHRNIYNRMMTIYLNPYSNINTGFWYDSIYKQENENYSVREYQYFYKSMAIPLNSLSKSYSFTTESYFSTSGLFVGWISFSVLVYYLSFLFFRKKDIF
ncbi:ABC transporter permease [Malacoplasma penetrans]|nr:ABC transporter permease [Malacoplasma penetrans]